MSERKWNVVSSCQSLFTLELYSNVLKMPEKNHLQSLENLTFKAIYRTKEKHIATWWLCVHVSACMCVLFFLLVSIVTALSVGYEKAPRSIQRHISWAEPHCLLFSFSQIITFTSQSDLCWGGGTCVKKAIEIAQIVSTEGTSWERG